MSIEAAIDKTALKVAAISGVKAAYGSGAYDTAVRTMTEDIPDTPLALVTLAEGEVFPGNWERLSYGVDVHLFFLRKELATAYKALVVMPDRFITAWRTDRDLGGTVTESSLTGWSPLVSENVNGVDFLKVIFHTRIKEVAGATYAV